MLTFDLKTLIFVLLLFLLAVAGGSFWLARRRARPIVALPDGGSLLRVLDDAPFGVAALEGGDVRYANPCAPPAVSACRCGRAARRGLVPLA